MHIGIIMDGNRRWATERGLPKMVGHTEGGKNIKNITKAAIDAGVTHLTLYTLSTENLKNRSEKELKHLFSLMEKLLDQKKEFEKNNVRVKIIGDLSKMPEKSRKVLQQTEENTKDHTGIVLTFAINYGGRDEILRAVNQAIEEGKSLETEEEFSNLLDTEGFPDVNLIIRTGGNKRLSNFLPWQGTYAEIYFTDTKWPGFTPDELNEIVDWWKSQQKNFGK